MKKFMLGFGRLLKKIVYTILGVGVGPIKSVVIPLLFFLAFIGFVTYHVHMTFTAALGDKAASKAVGYLYNFGSIAELDSNMDKLKEITTPKVYQQLTVDNTDRALTVYLKFKGKPSSVIIDKVTNSYVAYHLSAETISSSRKFIFMYNLNSSGLIDYVREVEAIDFTIGD